MFAPAVTGGGIVIPDGIELPPAQPRLVKVDDIAPMGLHSFWFDQGAWSDATFGAGRGPEAVRGSVAHFREEVREVEAEPTKLEEIADMQFLVFDAARRAGYSLGQLIDACYAKLAINKARKWTKVRDGFHKHVTE